MRHDAEYNPAAMRILYGVVGEGMGHAMRSRVILEHLFAAGHEVEIMASGRAAEFLRKHFAARGWVHRIHGMHIVYEDNRVRRGTTLWTNVLAGTAALPAQIGAYFELVSRFRAQLVISDFESWTYLYAKTHGVPILSIDNMQVLNRCNIDTELIDAHLRDFALTKAFVKSKLPFCDHYLIATFFRLPTRKPHTSLFPPILRPEIVNAPAHRGEHLLVYQTAEGYDSLPDALKQLGMECRIYGFRRGLTEDVVEQKLRFRPFSETTFIEDLASARAVIAGGGFTLMGEAVYLKKPMLAVPVRGQFEQLLNAYYLQKLGYGRSAKSVEDPAELQAFVDALPFHEEKLASYHQDGNTELLAFLDEKLAELAPSSAR
jgi:uncharacterized protein (TIGR00661 family)